MLAVALAIFLWPLAYAVWMSFSPGEFLEPPTGDWSLRWYRSFFADSQWTLALRHSFEVAALSIVGSLVSGVGVALAVVKHRFRGQRILEAAVLFPLFVPVVVLGMALLPTMRLVGLWGTLPSIALAHTLWSMPVVFLVARAAIAQVDVDLELAARGLGASATRVLFRVTLPLIAPALWIGAMMTFILSLNEFVMALFLSTPDIETLPKVIWPNLRYTLTPLVAAASGVTLALTCIGIAVVAVFVRRGRLRI